MDFSKVHVWLGVNLDDEDTYNQYFELHYYPDIDIHSPNYKVCQFCKDIGELWYDEDWIGVYRTGKLELVDISILLDELEVTLETLQEITKIALKKGFCEANAMFFYYDANTVIKDENKLYNKLTYLGMFDSAL